MGWERKRGKLLDLNKLLRNEYDSFPVKVGDLSMLPQGALRDHARLRHPTAPRLGAPHGRRDGASAQSGASSIPSATSWSTDTAFCSRASASA